MEEIYRRSWYLIYKDADSHELNRHFYDWFDGKSQDHHFEQVVRGFVMYNSPKVYAEHYANIDCVPKLSTVFFVSSINATAVNRSWVDNYYLNVKDQSIDINRKEFLNVVKTSTAFPTVRYNVIIPQETEEGFKTTLVSFYKGVLGGLCVISKSYFSAEEYKASQNETYPWEGMFSEVADAEMLDDAKLSRCMIDYDFVGNGFLHELNPKELEMAVDSYRHLYDEFLNE